MQVTQTRQVTTNIQNAVQFSISDDSAKLFSMLSSALYQDKEKAVVYELGANCYDANPHEPFLVVAPTMLDPQIKFRDYGPGLAEVDVYRLLTVYGASDKSNSNSKIGGYGIGAKSPAAVTDTWTVVSYFNGKAMEFMVYINENGIPSLTKIRETDTAETGLEVSIPVAQNRFDVWKTVLRSAFRYYPIKPIIKNCDVSYEDAKYVSSGSNWRLRECGGNTYSNNTNITFITTYRAYSSDVSKLELEFKDDPMLVALLRVPLIVDFSIGEMQLSLSRENIQYTKTTVAAIRTKLLAVKAELTVQINSILDTATDGFDFRQKIYEVENKVTGKGSLQHTWFSRVILGVINKRYSITNLHEDIKQFKVRLGGDFKSIATDLKPKVYNGVRMQAVTPKSTCFKSYAISVRSDINNRVEEFFLRFSIPVMDRIKIVIADTRDTSARVKFNFDAKITRFVMIINRNIFPKEMAPFVVNASSLTKAPRASKASAKKVEQKVDIFKFKRNSLSKIGESEAPSSTAKCAYVEFTNAKDIYSIKTKQWVMLRDYLEQQGWSVYGLKSDRKTTPKNFVAIEDAARQELNKVHNQSYFEVASINSILYEFEKSYRSDIISIFKTLDGFKTKGKSVWNDIIDQVKKFKAKADKTICTIDYYQYCNICRIFGEVPYEYSHKDFIDKVKRELYDTYKMLSIVNTSYMNSNTSSTIKEYIEQVGK